MNVQNEKKAVHTSNIHLVTMHYRGWYNGTRKLLRSHKGNWDRNYELIHKVFIKNFSSVS